MIAPRDRAQVEAVYQALAGAGPGWRRLREFAPVELEGRVLDDGHCRMRLGMLYLAGRVERRKCPHDRRVTEYRIKEAA